MSTGGTTVTSGVYSGVGVNAGNRIDAIGINTANSIGGFERLGITLSSVNTDDPVLTLT